MGRKLKFYVPAAPGCGHRYKVALESFKEERGITAENCIERDLPLTKEDGICPKDLQEYGIVGKEWEFVR